MRAAHNRRVRYLQVTQKSREIICRKISRCTCRRSPVSSAIIPNGVKVLAELGPHVIPRSGMKHAVMNQHNGLLTVAAFLVIKLRSLHFDKGARLHRRTSRSLQSLRREPDQARQQSERLHASAEPAHCALLGFFDALARQTLARKCRRGRQLTSTSKQGYLVLVGPFPVRTSQELTHSATKRSSRRLSMVGR